jgi:hypothetical protein
MVPPCHVRHSPPTVLMTPRLAVTAVPGRPRARTSAPTLIADASASEATGHLGFVDLEDGQIGARIAAGESRGDRRAVGERDGDVFLALDRVMRRDDDAGPPVDAGRGDTSPGVNRDDGLACAVDGAGEVV